MRDRSKIVHLFSYIFYTLVIFGAIGFLHLEYIQKDWLISGIVLVMSIALSISIYFFIRYKRDKSYYRKIIDSSTNIIVISNGEEILSANRAFFKYFRNFENIEAFKKEHSCICDFFVEKGGYLQKSMNHVNWLSYLLESKHPNHKVKMRINDEDYYFLIMVSEISKEMKHYAITLTDITQQEESKKELERLTVTDSLTKIGNRRYYQEKIKEEISRALRYKEPLSIILFDIDYFKKVNDIYGHDVGDRVLSEYSSYIRSMLREIDEFCRIGGEEFIIIAPHTDRDSAEILARKLRKAVEEYKKIVPITMSFGVTQYIEQESEDSLFKRADKALYKAKNDGRNRVVVE